MKSRYLSLFSANAPEGSDENTAVNEPENIPEEAASYSARYQAFLYQQSLRNQRANRQGSLDLLTSLGRGLLNLTLFVAFFFGFLTLFGFGLSKLGGNFNIAQSRVSASDSNPALGREKTTPAPAPRKNHRSK